MNTVDYLYWGYDQHTNENTVNYLYWDNDQHTKGNTPYERKYRHLPLLG